MKRKIYSKLLEWKMSSRRKPLILQGARQVGKSWILKEFGKKEYKNMAYISCDNEPLAKALFKDYDTDRILRSIFFLLLILMFPALCMGQAVENDITVKSYALPDSIGINLSNYSLSDSLSHTSKITSIDEFPHPIAYFDSLMYFGQFNLARNQLSPGTAVIPLWKDATFIATGDITDFPGLMQVHSGTIGITQNIGNLSLFVGTVANKYGYFNGLTTQYGLSGNLQYQFAPNISFTAFGTYYFGRPIGYPMIPAMIGFYGVSTFGGYMSYQFNNTFGVDVGAQTVQQFGTNKYHVEPIVTPTVKVGKIRIGLPVGQILHGMIRSQAKQRGRRK